MQHATPCAPVSRGTPPVLFKLQVETALLRTLDSVVAHVSEFTSPEHQLLRLLHLSPRALLPLSGLDSSKGEVPANYLSSVLRLDAAR
jgi:hypothetical protein